jgi:hypothetical protein
VASVARGAWSAGLSLGIIVVNRCLGRPVGSGAGDPGRSSPLWVRRWSPRVGKEAVGVLCSQVGLIGEAFGAGGACVELRCEWEWADGPGPGVVETSCSFECLAKTGGQPLGLVMQK